MPTRASRPRSRQRSWASSCCWPSRTPGLESVIARSRYVQPCSKAASNRMGLKRGSVAFRSTSALVSRRSRTTASRSPASTSRSTTARGRAGSRSANVIRSKKLRRFATDATAAPTPPAPTTRTSIQAALQAEPATRRATCTLPRQRNAQRCGRFSHALRRGAPLAAARDSHRGGAADLVLLGASIRTLDPDRPRATALAVRGETIVAVGSDAEVREHADARTAVVDGRGMAIVPGLVDAHIHPFHAEQTRGVDLTRCATLAEVQRELARARRQVGGDGWVLGWGLEYNVFGQRPVSAEAIDEAVGDAPALVTFFDLHTAVASRRALELAGVTGPRSFSEGAEVVVHDGRPTGELREDAAIELVRRLVPALDERERYAIVAERQRQLAAVGLSGLHVMDGTPRTFDLLRELEANGDLLLRCIVPFWITPETSFEEMEALVGLRDERGSLWRGGVAKFFIDGVIDTGTGWLYEPDTLGGGTAPFWPDPDRYAKAVRLFAQAGFQCATHATGDYGVRAALDAYRAAGAAPGVTHRIEHIETLQDEDLPRFAAQGVAASLQPLHMQWRRADHSDSWALRLGPERCARAWR